MCISIDYLNDTDTWYRYSFYYNKKAYRSDFFDVKTLYSIEEVKKEMIDICEAYGSIDYMCYDYDKELLNFNIYE